MRKRNAALAALISGAFALGPVAASAETAASLRPANLHPALASPEAGLWGEADKAEAHVKRSAELDADPTLTDHVHGVICKVAPEYCSELRIYVLDRPFFNAAAAPNGYVEVFSGLLLRARTDDELAFVLGHEAMHYARSHSLARWNATKTKANVVMALEAVVTIGAAAAMYSAASSGAPNAGQTINSISDTARALNDLVYLSALSSLFAYSREQESEADRLGFERLEQAGLDRSAGVAMWSDVLAEAQASDFKRVRESAAKASIFDTHPIESQRIAALKALGATDGQPSVEAQRRYRAVIRPHLAAWLKDDLRRRDFGQTLHLIDRLAALGEDRGVLEFYRGEALRQRRGDGDAAAALAAYKAAVTANDAPPAAWRELGDAWRKAGDSKAAADAYQAYITHAPEAEDRWLVEANLKSIGAPTQ